MNRRDLVKSTLLAAGALSSRGVPAQEVATPNGKIPQRHAHSFPQPPRKASGERMPNILWITADSQRADTIHALNNPHIRTPNLDSFMQQSVTLTNAFVQCPICAPSRASMLAGRYPHTTGLRANGQRIRADERLITRILADYDYGCGLVGKLHLSPCGLGQVENRIDDGYQTFEWSHDLTDSWPGQNAWLNWLQSQNMKWPANVTPPLKEPLGLNIDPKYTQTAWCADRAINFIHKKAKYKPWLMSVNIFQPHHPFMPTAEYLSHYDTNAMPAPNYAEGELDNKPIYQRIDHHGATAGAELDFSRMKRDQQNLCTAAYYAMIEQVDTELGRMLKALDDTGQADDTIVIYQSDHGEMLGDHGIYFKGPYFYDALTRVPLIIRWPNKFKAGLRSDALVEILDLAPTLLEAAGIPIPSGMQGHSLTPLLTGATTTHRDSVFTEYFDAHSLFDIPPMAACVRTATHKVAYYNDINTGELYDLVSDPGERNNLWASANHKDIQSEMMTRLASRLIGTTDPLPERLVSF